tara:strand:+ start:779 stop:1228 length:450 start_codon:yes stop_codon:yes gene_type:complete
VKITKSRLKQIILEEVKELLNPDSMEEDVDVDEDRSEPPYVPQVTLEEERTVPDDIERYVSRIEDSGHSVWGDDEGGVIIKREPEGAEVVRIFDSGRKGRQRYAVEWLPASGYNGTHLYDTIEHILSGKVKTTDGPERHLGQPTLQLEQ